MAIFKKKTTPIGNITYMALMAAINVIFILLTTWIPVLFILLVFILPLASTIVAYFCQKKYFIIYAVATIAVCSLVSFWDIGNVLFYVIPSIVSGLIFGVLIDKGISPIFIIISGVLAQIVLSYVAIPLIYLLYQRNIVTDFAAIVSLQNYSYLEYLQTIFICVLAIVQQTLSFMIIIEELNKIKINPLFLRKDDIIISFLTLFFIAFSVVFAFIYPEISYLGMMFSLMLAFYSIGVLIVTRKKWIVASLAFSLVVSMFLFALLYPIFPGTPANPLRLLLLQFFPLFCAIIVFINNYLLKKRNKDTIENR